MSAKISTFLMFSGEQHGKAEEAVKFYVSLFRNSEIERLEFYQQDDPEPAGTVKQAAFKINEQRFRAIDSNSAHLFGFTPAVSIFVECETEKEIDTVFNVLADGGQVLMPLDQYPFSRKYGWVQDRFEISWQLKWH